MKVSDLKSIYTVKALRVEDAKYLEKYIVQIFFNDGTNQNVDFENFLTDSQHPEIRKYLDKSLFQSFSIINGNLNWNEYDMIFPISDLHEGRII
jgi:hypothetical protein